VAHQERCAHESALLQRLVYRPRSDCDYRISTTLTRCIKFCKRERRGDGAFGFELRSAQLPFDFVRVRRDHDHRHAAELCYGYDYGTASQPMRCI
jgi:hypothetical protein